MQETHAKEREETMNKLQKEELSTNIARKLFLLHTKLQEYSWQELIVLSTEQTFTNVILLFILVITISNSQLPDSAKAVMYGLTLFIVLINFFHKRQLKKLFKKHEEE